MPKNKKSTVRHTRAIQRDRSKRPPVAPPDEKVEQRLSELLRPAIDGQRALYKELGLRERVLTLSVMMAIVASLVWRQSGSSSSEVARLLQREGLLWVSALMVSQQAISERLREFPPVLFLNILLHILPVLHQRWQARQRPLSPILAWAQARYSAVWVADGSTLDALVRKVGLLRESETFPLAGKMMALLDLCSSLPQHLWYDEDAAAHDQRFWPQIIKALPRGALLLFDLGFTNFAIFTQLTLAHCTFITRAKSNLAFHTVCVNACTNQVRDLLGWIGSGSTRQLIRLVKVYHRRTWYCFLTNELNPLRLPPEHIVALYRSRWRIEDAFNLVKRLLGLAYLWVGSQCGVLLQVWTTWILYAILVDLTDDVAEALNHPADGLSIEMVYRGLYHFAQAFQHGEAQDLVAYLADNAKSLGIIKRRRKQPIYLYPSLTSLDGP